MTIPYVYLIGWKSLDTWYCGVRYRKGCSPLDLWKSYFTSSKHVRRFRKQHGEPDHVEILKEFNNKEDAYNYEQEKLREFDVLHKDNWLNHAIGFNFGSITHHSDEAKEKISKAFKGKPLSEEHKRKISEANKGKEKTPEHIKNISLAAKGRIFKDETCQKISEANRGKIRSAESRKRYSAAKLGKKKPPFSEEHRRKLSDAAKNQKRYPMSKETKQKISEAKLKKKYNFIEL